MSEPYELDKMLDELFRFAEKLFQEEILPGSQSPSEEAVQTGAPEPDEVIEGRDRVTYLLNAPGYSKEEFLVSVLDDQVEVKTKDFLRRRGLGSPVDPESAQTTYRNGVLSVTLKRSGA